MDQSPLLSRVQSELLVFLGLFDDVIFFGDDQFDVRGRRLVGVDSTVSSVSTSSHLGGLVDLDVGHLQLGGVQTLGFGVRLGVDQKVSDESHRLFGPSTERGAVLLGLAGSADRRVESPEGDHVVVRQHSFEVTERLVDVHALDGLGGFPGVLERHSEVSTSGLDGLGRVSRGGTVTNHVDCSERRLS